MKMLTITDVEATELERQGISRSHWVLEQLRAHGFNLERPVHYRYDAHLGRTRIYQYEYAPDRHADQRDFDSELSEDTDWDLACELLLQETEQCLSDSVERP